MHFKITIATPLHLATYLTTLVAITMTVFLAHQLGARTLDAFLIPVGFVFGWSQTGGL
jgi:hypothetical protein